MYCILGVLILAVTFSGLETSKEFAEVWYREVILGEVQYAASTYDRIYTQRHPWQGSTEDERRIAALRAGWCFERLGLVEDASLAYIWLLQHGDYRSARWNVARSRLRDMARSGSLPGAAQLGETSRRGEVSLVRDALAHHLKESRREVESGKNELVNLERRLLGLKREVDLARAERLETRGVGNAATASHPSRGSFRGSFRESFRGSFRNELEGRLRTVLTEGFNFEEILPGVADAFNGLALRAVIRGDVVAAKRHFEQARALSAHHTLASDLVEKLDSWHPDSRPSLRGLADLARRYLLEDRLRQIGELQSKIRDGLVSARQRRRGGVRAVVEIWQMAERALPDVRREAEIAHLVREADRLFLALTTDVSTGQDGRPPGEELREFLVEREQQLRTASDLVVQIVEVTSEKVALQIEASDRDRPDTIEVAARKVRRLLAEGRSFLVTGSLAKCEASIRQVEPLLSWFPSLDHYRNQLRRLQHSLALELPIFQEELDSQQ